MLGYEPLRPNAAPEIKKSPNTGKKLNLEGGADAKKTPRTAGNQENPQKNKRRKIPLGKKTDVA